MSIGLRRLNRRRYRESVNALKEIIADPKTTQARKLQAINTLLGIYDRHDRSEAQRVARKQAAESAQGNGQPQESLDTPESDLEAALAQLRAEREGVLSD